MFEMILEKGKLVLRCLGALVVLGLWFQPGAEAQGPTSAGDVSVSKIEILGNRRIDSAAIRAQVSAQPGTITRSTIADDIRAIYRTGFFVQASASVVEIGTGSRALRYTVTEKPVVRKIFIKGNKEIDEKDLSEYRHI